MVRLEALTKRYGAHEAVRNLSLHVPAGERFRFPGPNGAGKTTTTQKNPGPARPPPGRTGVLLPLVELPQVRSQLIESSPHGMKQRLVMASAFLHQPKVMVVDEPMGGLGPTGGPPLKQGSP